MGRVGRCSVAKETAIVELYARAQNWVIGSDPGLLRLRMAIRTMTALVCALAILWPLTRLTGQPLTVALLGVLITMIAGRAINEPDSHQQHITLALLPLPAALAITAGTLLAPHKIAAEIVFVAIVFTGVYIRRFGARGTALGMVMFMAYFFTLYLQAKFGELPWLVGAVAVGTVCSFAVTYLLPDRPQRVLKVTIRSLRARMAIVVDATADVLAAGRFDERWRHRLHARTARLNETALMVQDQIEEQVNPAALRPGVSVGQLALWLFDAELTVERVATAGARAAALVAEQPAAIPVDTRAAAAAALAQLAKAIRASRPSELQRAADRGQRLLEQRLATSAADNPDNPGAAAVRRLALAIVAAATAAAEVRALVEHAVIGSAGTGASTAPAAPEPAVSEPAVSEEDSGGRASSGSPTRQAIQVTVAASLAIAVGGLVSPARWYWAVIAAFVIFAGTNSWAETLTKGWQRLLGTVLGVPCGVLVATLVSGNRVVSVVLIFVCLFFSLYFLRVAYSLMTFWITTMLALLYGLLGQFNFDVLLLRVEETAIGAVIGVAVAILVLPTNAKPAIRNDAHDFLTTLSELIDTSMASLLGVDTTTNPTDKARQLDRNLQRFRITAKPLIDGPAAMAGRRSLRRGRRVLTACDRYGRTLARNSQRYDKVSPELADAITSAAAQIRRNIEVLDTREHAATAVLATDFLDAAEALIKQTEGAAEPNPATRRVLTALYALRQIDRAVVTAAIDLGAVDGLTLAG